MSPDEKAWQDIRLRIVAAAKAAHRDPGSIRVLAVSKSFPIQAVQTAYSMGLRAFGENYVQEARPKIAALSELPGIEWHLIGPLQSNKARAAAQSFSWVETIDRHEIAERLSVARDVHFPPLNVCIQVNISGETTKHGVIPSMALALAREVGRLPGLALRGFMGVAQTGAAKGLRSTHCRWECRRISNLPLPKARRSCVSAARCSGPVVRQRGLALTIR
jgi:PLP dependent protein